MTYEYLEKPVRFGKFSNATKAVPVVLITFIVGAGLLGMETYRTEGFISRFPFPFVKHLANYQNFLEIDSTRQCASIPESIKDLFSATEACFDPDDNMLGKPLVVLWGDSFAAHLRSGLKDLQNTQNFRLVEFSRGGCPSFVFPSQIDEGSGEKCNQSNKSVSEAMIRLRPKTVILSTRWDFYFTHVFPGRKERVVEKINETVALLKKAGVDKIILIGQTPHWKPALPKLLFTLFKDDPTHQLPNRMWRGLDLEIKIIDKDLHEAADKLGILYASPYNVFCNVEGCLTKFGDEPKDLVVFDYGHYTPSAARFFINKVFTDLPIA